MFFGFFNPMQSCFSHPLVGLSVTYEHSHTDIIRSSLEYVWSSRKRQSMDQPGKVDNSARGQLNRENKHFPARVRA